MDEKIIWTNGCFDILHVGHIELFKYAKSLGTKLYVGIDSDEKVKLDKGDDRPFNKLADRIKVLESIKYIDKVVSFSTPARLENLVKEYKPHVLIVGSDWRNKYTFEDVRRTNGKEFNCELTKDKLTIGEYSFKINNNLSTTPKMVVV